MKAIFTEEYGLHIVGSTGHFYPKEQVCCMWGQGACGYGNELKNHMKTIQVLTQTI